MYSISKTKLLLFIITAPFSNVILGEVVDTLQLNASQAVEIALADNKALTAARFRIEQAQARFNQSGRLDNPEFKVGYSTDRTFNNEDESTFEIAFEQRFPITNRLHLLKSIAKIEISMAEMEIKNQERVLMQEVENTITSLTHVEKQLDLRRTLIELNKEFVTFVESRIETGESSTVEVNLIKIELYSVEQEIGQLVNKRIELVSKLRGLLGVDENHKVEITEELILPLSFEQLPDFSNSLLQQHPEYQFKTLLYEVADKQVSLAMAQRWGDIAVEVFFENERSVDEPYGAGSDRFFGIGLSIPLPLNNRYRGAIDESQSYRRQIDSEMEAVSLELSNRASALRDKTHSLYSQAQHYNESVTALVEQNLNEMNDAYGAGQISLTDLFRSQEQRLKIQSTYLSMVYEFKQALSDWRAITANQK